MPTVGMPQDIKGAVVCFLCSSNYDSLPYTYFSLAEIGKKDSERNGSWVVQNIEDSSLRSRGGFPLVSSEASSFMNKSGWSNDKRSVLFFLLLSPVRSKFCLDFDTSLSMPTRVCVELAKTMKSCLAIPKD